MTTEEPKEPKSGRWQFSLRSLVIVHVVAWFIGLSAASIGQLTNIFDFLTLVPLLYGQLCLLGVWLALGTNALHYRVAGTLTGIALLAMITGYRSRMPLNEVFIQVLPIVASFSLAVAAVLLVVRRWKAHLVAHGSGLPVAAIEGLQFSIRHLFLLTTVVAVLLMFAQGIGLVTENASWLGTSAYIGLLALCLVAITVGTVWAGLGVGRPIERIILVMFLAFFTGLLFVYATTGRGTTMISWQQAWPMPTLMVLTAAIVTASLLVVRSNGYRLVRRSP